MHHRITYMHISFQQNWASRSVKTVGINMFAKNCKLHKFVKSYIPIVFFLNILLQTCIIINYTCISIFSKIRLIGQSKPCTQIYLCNNIKLVNTISVLHPGQYISPAIIQLSRTNMLSFYY